MRGVHRISANDLEAARQSVLHGVTLSALDALALLHEIARLHRALDVAAEVLRDVRGNDAVPMDVALAANSALLGIDALGDGEGA